MTGKRYGVSFGDDENVLNYTVMIDDQLCDYPKKTTEYFKEVTIMLCELISINVNLSPLSTYKNFLI